MTVATKSTKISLANIFNKYKTVGPSGINKCPLKMSKEETRQSVRHGKFPAFGASDMKCLAAVIRGEKPLMIFDFIQDDGPWANMTLDNISALINISPVKLVVKKYYDGKVDCYTGDGNKVIKKKSYTFLVYRKGDKDALERIPLLFQVLKDNIKIRGWKRDVIIGTLLGYTIDDISYFIKRNRILHKTNYEKNPQKWQKNYNRLSKVDEKHDTYMPLSKTFQFNGKATNGI